MAQNFLEALRAEYVNGQGGAWAAEAAGFRPDLPGRWGPSMKVGDSSLPFCSSHVERKDDKRFYINEFQPRDGIDVPSCITFNIQPKTG